MTRCNYGTGCKNPALPNRPKCKKHLKLISDNKKRKMTELKVKGICTNCKTQPAEKTYVHCRLCRAASRKSALELRLKVLRAYGSKCNCCGEDEYNFLAMDHIENDGAKHRRAIGGGARKLYYWLVKNNFPEGFQVLCHNCNVGKHHNGGTCPHKTGKTVV